MDEKPFRPLDVSILSAVVQHAALGEKPDFAGRKVVELARSPEPERTSAASLRPPVTPRLDQEKRVLYTRGERQALDRLVNNLAVRLNAQVKLSHVMRALTMLLLQAENQIDQRAGDQGSLVRPSNGDFAALQEFERTIACILAEALRDAGLPR